MTELINSIDFTQPHDRDDFLHYANRPHIDGIPTSWVFESYEKSTRSVVYRGPISYWERSNKSAYETVKLKKRSNYKSIISEEIYQKQKEEELDAGVLRKEKKVDN